MVDSVLGQFETYTDIRLIGIRMLVAALLGGVIGLNREWREKPAGLKTHILVAVGAATFSILAIELFRDALEIHPEGQSDPVRVVEAIIKGAAFLGAGAIIQGRGSVSGITTGASIWLVAAVGLASGTGHIGIAVLATIFGLVVLTVLQAAERGLKRRRSRGDRNGDEAE